MKPGDRVVTPHYGAGCIIAMDMANDTWPGQPVRLVSTGRWCVKLDDPSTWFKNGIACFYPNELTLETQSAP